jgi:hypothetical protein
MQPKQGNGATMIHEVLVSITSTWDLGQLMSNFEAFFLGLNVHIFIVPSLPSLSSPGLQVAFGTQTI